MLTLQFALFRSMKFPFPKWVDLSWEPLIAKHKAFEFQLTQFETGLFDVNLYLEWNGTDHAGPRFSITLFGLYFCLAVYDTRHWNDEENRWYRYDEDPFE